MTGQNVLETCLLKCLYFTAHCIVHSSPIGYAGDSGARQGKTLDFVTLSHILAYKFQIMHILINIYCTIWKVQEKNTKLRYITSLTGISTEN